MERQDIVLTVTVLLISGSVSEFNLVYKLICINFGKGYLFLSKGFIVIVEVSTYLFRFAATHGPVLKA